MRKIEIDDEIYAHLEAHVKGFEQPNDVLRRLLLSPATGPDAANAGGAMSPGALAPLIKDGRLAAGDELVHVRVRSGSRFEATVEPDGWIRTSKGRYKRPSPALKEFVGTEVDGWANWTHVKTKKTLGQLRDEP